MLVALHTGDAEVGRTEGFPALNELDSAVHLFAQQTPARVYRGSGHMSTRGDTPSFLHTPGLADLPAARA